MIYDIIVDLIKHFSVSLDILKPYATLLGVIVLLLRQNNIKKIINRQLPKRFRDTQSNDIYDIMKDIKAIKEHLGVKDWENTQLNGQETIPILSYKRFFLLLQAVMNHTKLRRKSKMLIALRNPWSKKLFAFIVLVLLNGLNDTLQLHLSPDTINRISTLGMTYIVSQAGVDALKPLIMLILAKFSVNPVGGSPDVKPTIDTESNK